MNKGKENGTFGTNLKNPLPGTFLMDFELFVLLALLCCFGCFCLYDCL